VTLAQAYNAALWLLNVYVLGLLILCWCSFLGCGNEHVLYHLSCNTDQYIHFGRSWQCSPVIVECVRPKIVDAPVTLIFGLGNKHDIFLFAYHADQCIHFGREIQLSRSIVECVQYWFVDAAVMLIFKLGQWACHLPLLLSRRPRHSIWKDETMLPYDCRLCITKNRWCSIDAHINDIKMAFVHSIIACNILQTHYWRPILRFWVLSFALEALWHFNFSSTSINIVWVRNDVDLSDSCTFGWQFKVYRSFHYVLINIARIPHLTSSIFFSSISVTHPSNFIYFYHLCQVCAEINPVGWVDKCSMMVVIQTDSDWARTAPSMTSMTSLSYILLVYFVHTIPFAFSLNSNRHTETELIGYLWSWCGF